MDPGIGASRPVDHDPLASVEAGKRGLELSLDRPGIPLELEPGEIRAVVFTPRAVAHGRALSSAHVVAADPADACVATCAPSLTHRSALARVLGGAFASARLTGD